MTIKGRIIFIVSVLIVGVLLITSISLFRINNTNSVIKDMVDGTFMNIIKKDIPATTDVNKSLQLLLNADRDAYQALIAQYNAMNTTKIEKLKKIKELNDSNTQQVWDRTEKSSITYNEEMNELYSKFKKEYKLWKTHGNDVLSISIELAESYKEKQIFFDKSMKIFTIMRNNIDKIAGLAEEKIEKRSGNLQDLRKSYGLILNADRDAYQAHVAILKIASSNDHKLLSKYIKSNKSNTKQVIQRLTKASKYFDRNMQKVFNDVKIEFKEWKEYNQNYIEVSDENFFSEQYRKTSYALAKSHFETMRDLIDQITEKLDARQTAIIGTINKNSGIARQKANKLEQNLESSISFLIICCVIIIAASILIALLSSKKILSSMKKILLNINNGTINISYAAEQMSSASKNLANGSIRQAADIEEISGTIDEINSMTKQNNQNTQKAQKLVSDTEQAAQNGSEAINKMVQSIDKIQKSSKETSNIIKVIDEIAFQTNILALNAAVEAARAGDAGKGFAVVSEEVRNLAMRSADAARNTTGMIEDSIQNSNEGVVITQQVTENFEKIIFSISEITKLINEIANANSEQAEGISQVAGSVNQVNNIIQSNATNSEETANTSGELQNQANMLKKAMLDLTQMVEGIKESSKLEQSAIKEDVQTDNKLTVQNHLQVKK